MIEFDLPGGPLALSEETEPGVYDGKQAVGVVNTPDHIPDAAVLGLANDLGAFSWAARFWVRFDTLQRPGRPMAVFSR